MPLKSAKSLSDGKTAPIRKKKFRMRSKYDQKKQEEKRGVILLSHIPRGFYEQQMLPFFSQFGEVTRLRLIRSKKTGGSRHFAFIEFRYEDVAKIAAETMNFYLMFRKVLRCKFIPSEEIAKGTFVRWRETFVPTNNTRKEVEKYNRHIIDPEKIAKRTKRITDKRMKLQKKLQELGIEYDVINVKKNESFIPPRRSRASVDEIQELRKLSKVAQNAGRCGDFDYSDDEKEDSDEVASAQEDDIAVEENVKLKTKQQTAKSLLRKEGELKDTEIVIPASRDNVQSQFVLDDTKSSDPGSDEFAVMVVDPDDIEVTFKTPPVEAKIKRRTLRRPADVRMKRLKMLQKLQQTLNSDDE